MNKAISIAILILVAIITLVILRIFSEDTWICDNGQWVKHGQPSKPMPTAICLPVTTP